MKMTKRFFKSKHMHNKNNYLSNWSSSKNIGSHGKGKQVHEPFSNWMTIMLTLIPLNFKKWNALCVITSRKKIAIIIYKVGKVWLSITRTMAQLPWIVMFILNTLQFRFFTKHNNDLLLPSHMLFTKLLKRGKNQLHVPLLVSLPLESRTKRLTLFKNHSLRIWCFTLPKATILWAPLKMFSWENLCIIKTVKLSFLIGNNSLMKLSLTWLIRPWNVMFFLHLLCRNSTLEEWEDDSRTPELGTWESIGTPETSEFDFRGQNTSHWSVLYIIEKLSKFRCRKWACMSNLDICSTSYVKKKGRESNW